DAAHELDPLSAVFRLSGLAGKRNGQRLLLFQIYLSITTLPLLLHDDLTGMGRWDQLEQHQTGEHGHESKHPRAGQTALVQTSDHINTSGSAYAGVQRKRPP